MRTNAREVCGHNLVGQDPSDSKSNRLHVDIFRCCFHSVGAYSIDSFKMLSNSHEVSNFNQLFLKLIGSFVTNHQFSPDIDANSYANQSHVVLT